MWTLRRVWRFLGRTGIASLLLLLLLLFSLLGSLLPQLPPSFTGDPERLAAWLVAARERWGMATDGLYRWGTLTFFRSPLLLALLTLILLSTLSCTLHRWRAVWRRALQHPLRPPTDVSFPDSSSITLPALSPANLQAALEERGYRVQVISQEGITRLRADRYGLSEMATLLTHLAALLLVAAYGLTGWLGWQAEVTVGPGEAVGLGYGSALLARNDGFTIEHYPDGSVADYQARVTLLEADHLVAQGTIGTNRPLRYRGLGVFLMGFREEERGTALTLKVVRDPGRDVALVGGMLLLAGVTTTIYLPHRRIYARFEPERTVLIGRSSWQDDGIEREMEGLTQGLAGW